MSKQPTRKKKPVTLPRSQQRGPSVEYKNDRRKRHLFLPHPFFLCFSYFTIPHSTCKQKPSLPPSHSPWPLPQPHHECLEGLPTQMNSDHLFGPGAPPSSPQSARGPCLSMHCCRAAITSRVPQGPSGRKEVEQKIWGRSQSWAGIWVGAVGRSCYGVFLAGKRMIFFHIISCVMTVTIYSKISISFLFSILKNVSVPGKYRVCFYQKTCQVKS